ncbi:MAG: preprotein translocase subunit SecY, partial [Candidatus Methanomethylicota archaeon]
LQMMGAMLANKGVPILGEFDAQGNPTSGFVYYITVPHALILSLLHGAFSSDLLLRALGHVLFFVIGSVIFSVLWVETAGMDAKSVAKQITSIGLQIPGFRRDPRIVEQVLSRYIMPLAVMGGAFVGFLAAFANFMGALGTGTGILLTVMIIYNFYETIAYRYMEEMHPALRKFFEG